MLNLPLPDLLRAVAKLLGDYVYAPIEDVHDDVSGYLNGPEGACIFVSTTWVAKGRLYLSGSLAVRRGVKLDITVADSATPERIAAEIQRRILPVYLPALRDHQERLRGDALRQDGRLRLIHEFAERIGASGPSDRDGKLEVDLAFGGLTVEQARALLGHLETLRAAAVPAARTSDIRRTSPTVKPPSARPKSA